MTCYKVVKKLGDKLVSPFTSRFVEPTHKLHIEYQIGKPTIPKFDGTMLFAWFDKDYAKEAAKWEGAVVFEAESDEQAFKSEIMLFMMERDDDIIEWFRRAKEYPPTFRPCLLCNSITLIKQI